MIKNPKKIVISRTDSIGDVVLTLPLAGILRERFPTAKIIFLGNTYTKPIIQCCEDVDEIWEWAEIEKKHPEEQIQWLVEQDVDTFIHVFPRKAIARLAKNAKIKNRIGTSHRAYHWFNCNYRLHFSRKRSNFHEAQLNTRLLEPLRIGANYSLKQLFQHIAFTKIPEFPEKYNQLLTSDKKNVILHVKSQGSAVEWGIPKFMELAKALDPKKFNIYFTGTEKEAKFFRPEIPKQENIFDLSGQMTLDELIVFIAASDVLVAASTGPLHIAGITNIRAVGLFSSKRPIHFGRWKPLGNTVFVFEDKKSSDLSQPLDIPLRDILRTVESTV
ncbi:MAG: glycosyltransferase family 9 protein [Crocinitomix sp.]|nr:glycosyltransferase family 9 protein [Crocinitomix sp.]